MTPQEIATALVPTLKLFCQGALRKVIEEADVRIINYYSREVENSAVEWLDFNRTEGIARQQILELMQRDLDGVSESGMRPFFKENKLKFMHTLELLYERNDRNNGS